MTPKLVIFDCDGVLVDTEPVTDRVISANLTRHGLPIAPDEVHQLFAGGTMASVKEVAASRGVALPDDWLNEIYGDVFDALRAGVPVIDGVQELISDLDRNGIQRAIASNGPMAKMDISLAPSGLLEQFAGRIYSGHTYQPKPKPDMLLQIMADVGVCAKETVMIDDMPAGFQAARAAGIRCFAYVADGDPARAHGTGATAVRSMQEIARSLGLHR